MIFFCYETIAQIFKPRQTLSSKIKNYFLFGYYRRFIFWMAIACLSQRFLLRKSKRASLGTSNRALSHNRSSKISLYRTQAQALQALSHLCRIRIYLVHTSLWSITLDGEVEIHQFFCTHLKHILKSNRSSVACF